MIFQQGLSGVALAVDDAGPRYVKIAQLEEPGTTAVAAYTAHVWRILCHGARTRTQLREGSGHGPVVTVRKLRIKNSTQDKKFICEGGGHGRVKGGDAGEGVV